jgi:hypothetical protein
LISAGHRQADLPAYTLAQVRGFLAADARRERQAAHLALCLARAARAANEGFNAVLQVLEEPASTNHQED